MERSMDDKKYQIFISSTFKDLENARDKVIETILKLYHFPIGMEMFSADDDEQWEVIRDTIDSADYYVLLIGHRYGSMTEDGISYTEKEYNYAKAQGVPILAFIRERAVATMPHDREDSSSMIKKLNKFIEKASSSKMCDFWKKEDDLSTKVAIALPKTFRKNPRVGWIRGDLAISPAISNELAALSKENRDLKKRNQDLEQLQEKRLPILITKINGESEVQLKLIEKEDLKFKFFKNTIDFTQFDMPQLIHEMNIPSHLREYVSDNDYKVIQDFNDSIPSQEDLDQYNSLVEDFFRIKGQYIRITIEIQNIGNVKANEIHIDIDYPENVLVMFEKDVDDYEFPSKPYLANPLDVAEKKYQEDLVKKASPFQSSNVIGGSNVLRDFPSPMDQFTTVVRDMNITRDYTTKIDQDNKRIILKINNLLHTRRIEFDNFFVIPLSEGKSTINITTVCEEFSEPLFTSIPVGIK